MTSLLIYKTNVLNAVAADVKTYLLTAISGGLNQQRRGITDALVVAYILNATLLVLKLGQKLFWKDSRSFSPYHRYKTTVKVHGVQLTKFDYKLSNKLDSNLQKLRCRANYHALKFNDLINEMGKTLVDRMRMKSKHFIALHLRLVAFNLGYLPGGDKTIIRVRNNTEEGIGSCKKYRGAWRSYQFSGLCGASWWMVEQNL
ncbi:root hair specific 17 [Prunus dulcis]|uniref:O-fucosyltransferase family protein n=1 Tax=Prunus dulcis TaxID=3755 RepID=A0A5H2XV24_PRUDU|nr:root hair specific 17 [Prunus dulcis]